MITPCICSTFSCSRCIVCWASLQELNIPVPGVFIPLNSFGCNTFLDKMVSTMSSWLIIVTGLIYAYIALEQGIKGNMAMAVVYSGYAFSNVGLYILATK